jgi:hypothetical protein
MAQRADRRCLGWRGNAKQNAAEHRSDEKRQRKERGQQHLEDLTRGNIELFG